MLIFLAHFLVVLSAWTVTIKFLFPVAMALAEGLPLATYVWWDFWWVAHLWLAWALLTERRHAFLLGLGVSAAEIAIVVVKLWLFLAAPAWTIWTANWFINKLFVLAVFVLLLPTLLLRWRAGRLPAAQPVRGGE